MALVGVEHFRRGAAGELLEGAQGLDPAHAQQELLLQAVVAAAAVQAVGDAARGLVVARNVGVQQQQRNTPDVGAPDVRQQPAAVGERQRDLEGLAVAVGGGLAQQGQRQPVRIQDRIGFLLPGVAGQGLLEIAGLVEQADADQRHAQVRGCLQVVAGKDAEAAGVLRQHLGDAELGGEVGDARRCAVAEALVPAGLFEVPVEVLGGGVDPAHHVLVRGEALQLLPADQSEEAHRIVVALGPDLRVQALEKLPRGPVPGPPKVGGQPGKRPDRLGKNGSDGKSADCLHLRNTNRQVGGPEPV